MRRIEPRLARLAALPKGGEVCRLWWEVAVVDGGGNTQRTERFPDCGRHVEIRLLHRTVLAPSPVGEEGP